MVERPGKNILIEVIKVQDIHLEDPTDPVADYVSRLAESEERLKEPLTWRLSHRRRRSAPDMRRVLEERSNLLQNTQAALKVLRGLNFSEATFYKDLHGAIIGFKVDSPDND